MDHHFIITNLRITRGIKTYNITYTDGTESKTSLINRDNDAPRKIDRNRPSEVSLFMHMKICLLSFFHNEISNEQLKKFFNDPNYCAEVGVVELWSEMSKFILSINNLDEKILLKKIE